MAQGPRPYDPLFVLREHTDSVLCCNFFPRTQTDLGSPLTNWLLTGDVSGAVKLWDLSLRRSLLTLYPALHARQLESAELAPPLPALSAANPGVMSVGFLWLTANSLQDKCVESAPHIGPPSAMTVTSVTSSQRMELSKNTPGNVVGSAQTSQRQRFRLTRPSQSTSSSPTSSNETSETLVFYTQCRNQNLYIWSTKVKTNGRRDAAAVFVPQPDALTLQYKLLVPQHGFCAVDVYTSHKFSALIAVPHDTNGQLTVWRVTDTTVLRTEGATGTVLSSDSHENTAQDTQDAALATMDPRAALIARAQAEEEARRQARESSASASSGAIATAVSTSGVVNVTHVRTFSACGSVFKGGVLMQIRFRDEAHVSASFESGHVSLWQFSEALSSNPASRPFQPRLLCATRAFAEPAATCLWTAAPCCAEDEDSRIVATSASGHVQCYTLSPPTITTATAAATESSLVTPTLCWEQRFRKGIGSTALQGHLLVLGIWDQTVRAIDVRTGELLSILTQHSGTVQQVAAVPSHTAALQASFGFDSRHPHLYAADARRLLTTTTTALTQRTDSAITDAARTGRPGDAVAAHTSSPSDADTHLLYLFCSCSDDGTVAVWRVDLHDIIQSRAPHALSEP